MSTLPPLSEADDLLAAELALGLIENDERRQAEARLASEAAFAAAHDRWQGHAAGLLAAPEEAPRPSLWTAIAARLPANDAAPASARLRRWQGGAIAASVVALLLAGGLVNRPVIVRPGPTPPPVQLAAATPLMAVLTGKTGAVVAISLDRAAGRLTAAPVSLDLARKVPQLWVIPPDGKPRSLGVIGADQPGTVRPAREVIAYLTPGATLAVSVEPIGGSPTGLPTGPVILTGTIGAS